MSEIKGMDFKYLHENRGVDLQVAGSDQWGNIIAGVDLSRKIGFSEGKRIEPLFGLTVNTITVIMAIKIKNTAR